MPIYEYKCNKCGDEFEAIQKITDKPLKSCPTCKGKVKKLISRNSFILKGSGWYVTDYARKDQKTAENNGNGVSTPKKEEKKKKEDKPSSEVKSKPESNNKAASTAG